MKTVLFILLAIVPISNMAYAERSYTMIPDAVEQAEQFSESADRLGRSHTQQPPRTAGEAMYRLHRIDAELERIILLARRFQQTTHLLEQGIHDAQRLARKNNAFIVEWGPILQGNYQLIHASLDGRKPDDMRTMVAIGILENLTHSIAMRMKSAGMAMSLQLQFSREARIIDAARQRVHLQLTDVRKGLNTIRNSAQTRM